MCIGAPAPFEIVRTFLTIPEPRDPTAQRRSSSAPPGLSTKLAPSALRSKKAKLGRLQQLREVPKRAQAQPRTCSG